MAASSSDDLGGLLNRAQAGDGVARDGLVEMIYQDLRAIAARRMRRERPDHTLQPTALVNEALRKILTDATLANASDRTFIYSAAAKAMEQVLIDHHRRRAAQKGAGGWRRTPLDAVLDHLATSERPSFTDLHGALGELARLDERAALVVRFHFFLGMPYLEIADAMGISVKTVERDWRFARGWLFERLEAGERP